MNTHGSPGMLTTQSCGIVIKVPGSSGFLNSEWLYPDTPILILDLLQDQHGLILLSGVPLSLSNVWINIWTDGIPRYRRFLVEAGAVDVLTTYNALLVLNGK